MPFKTCPHCREPFAPHGREQYCSPTCKQRAQKELRREQRAEQRKHYLDQNNLPRLRLAPAGCTAPLATLLQQQMPAVSLPEVEACAVGITPGSPAAALSQHETSYPGGRGRRKKPRGSGLVREVPTRRLAACVRAKHQRGIPINKYTTASAASQDRTSSRSVGF
jgi:hypothetical protein